MASALPERVTAPRQILKGTVYLLTRRCFQRQFLLRPSAATNDVFLYVLAVAAKRFGIRVHVLCVLSNHFHMLVTDPGARLPAFEQYLNSLVARAVNASLGRWESFWAPSSYSAVALATPRDIVEKAAYVLANPVAAGLVRRGKEWPGLWSDPATIGGSSIVVRRPKTFFRDNGGMPEEAELELTQPEGFSPDEFRTRVSDALAACEERHTYFGRSFVGAARVRAQSPWGRPTTPERQRELSPRVAARDKWKRIEALMRLKAFLTDYRDAWRKWTSGIRDVLFPAGTYAMRVAHGVSCCGGA